MTRCQEYCKTQPSQPRGTDITVSLLPCCPYELPLLLVGVLIQ